MTSESLLDRFATAATGEAVERGAATGIAAQGGGAPALFPPSALIVGESLIDIIDRDGRQSRHVGGSPLNVATGLARLGIDVRFATEYGDDDDGTTIANHLRSAGVDTTDTSSRTQRTSTALARIGDDGSAAYTFDVSWEFTAPPVTGNVDLVHVGSIGALSMPGAANVLAYVDDLPDDTLFTFDPNIRPHLMPETATARQLVERYATRADIVKLSAEDAEWLYPGRSDAAEILMSHGARLVAVTDGGSGSTLSAGGERTRIPRRPIEVADTIGAGDAYMSGLIAVLLLAERKQALRDHLLSAEDLTAIGDIATASARITVSRPGAFPPTLPELLQDLGSPCGE